MRASFFLASAVFAGAIVSAKDIVITVGVVSANATDNSTVFNPQSVTANVGDTVLFNFTAGNHSATESLFASPCIPAHLADPSLNGFNSGQRVVSNGSTAVEIHPVPILKIHENHTFWFFDYNTCSTGGVGVININTTKDETLDGFARNAARLNGTDEITSSASQTSTSTSARASATNTGNSAERLVVQGMLAAVPLIFAALLA